MRTRILAGVLLAAGVIGLGPPAGADIHKGVRAGASVGKLRSAPTRPETDVELAGTPGLTGGSYVTIDLGRWLAVQPELSIAQTGAMMTIRSDLMGGFMTDQRLSLTYLQLPVLVRATPLPDSRLYPYAGAGLFVGLLVQGNVSQDDVERDVTDQVSTWDAGFVGAVGLALHTSSGRIELEGRYAWGGPRLSDEFNSGTGTYALTLAYSWDD